MELFWFPVAQVELGQTEGLFLLPEQELAVDLHLLHRVDVGQQPCFIRSEKLTTMRLKSKGMMAQASISSEGRILEDIDNNEVGVVTKNSMPVRIFSSRKL